MKKIIALFSACLFTAASFAFDPPDPNTKVLKAFSETFSTASNVKWQEFSDYYSVSFTNHGTLSRVRYDLDGNIISSTRYYEPSQLPVSILARLKRENPTRQLFGVTEITVNEQMVYLVKMFDKKHWITLSVDVDGNSTVYEKYKKI
jgi:hypothetical protein